MFRVCRPDSTSRWIEVRTVPVECGSGALAGHSGVVQDISERWTSDRRIAARDAITRILAHAESAGSACRAILGEVGEILGLSMGVFWEIDRKSQTLGVTAVWPGSAADFPAFETAVRQTEFPPGIGLPGRVWAGREPAWIPDVSLDVNFPRARAAAQEGLHGAFAFPVTSRRGNFRRNGVLQPRGLGQGRAVAGTVRRPRKSDRPIRLSEAARDRSQTKRRNVLARCPEYR